MISDIANSHYFEKSTRIQHNSKYANGIWRAEVVENEDPLKLGRLKVRVIGLYDDIPNISLPYADPSFPYGGGSNYGMFYVPPKGATVWVAFEQGDLTSPVWIGSFYGRPFSKNEVPLEYQGLPEASGAFSAFDPDPLINESAFNKPIYGNNIGIKTPGGIVIEYDDTPGSKRIHLYHPSGSHLEFRNNGDVALHVVGNFIQVINGNAISRIDLNEIKEVFGNVVIKIFGSLTQTVTGIFNKVVLGISNVTVFGVETITNLGRKILSSVGKTEIITADSEVTISGASVYTYAANNSINTSGDTVFNTKSMTSTISGNNNSTIIGDCTETVTGALNIKRDPVAPAKNITIDAGLGNTAIKGTFVDLN